MIQFAGFLFHHRITGVHHFQYGSEYELLLALREIDTLFFLLEEHPRLEEGVSFKCYFAVIGGHSGVNCDGALLIRVRTRCQMMIREHFFEFLKEMAIGIAAKLIMMVLLVSVLVTGLISLL